MKTISSYFNQVCTQKYQSLGFARCKSTFFRIKGDILQAFTLKHTRGIPNCSVDFGIFPLCLPQPVILDAGGYMLDEFIIDLHERSSGWIFDASSDDSVIGCIESISQALDVYLLPFFEICCDCKAALPELIKLEELFDRNRQMVLHLRGNSDSAAPWQERSMFDSRKYFMAIKAHNLSYMQQYLNHQVNFYKAKMKSFEEPDSPRQPDIVKERFLARFALCLEQLKLLDSGDFAYFENLINSNENQMYEFLVDKYPRISGN